MIHLQVKAPRGLGSNIPPGAVEGTEMTTKSHAIITKVRINYAVKEYQMFLLELIYQNFVSYSFGL